MLTRVAMGFDGVAEQEIEYALGVDYEHEHRFTEHEHDFTVHEHDFARFFQNVALRLDRWAHAANRSRPAPLR